MLEREGAVEDDLTASGWAGAGDSASVERGVGVSGAEAEGSRDFEMSSRADLVDDGLNTNTGAKGAVDLVSADRGDVVS